MSVITLEEKDFDRLAQAIASYGEHAEERISDVIHSSGDTIRDRIDPLIHASGRTFKGHRSGARGTAWARYITGVPLEITVHTVPSRGYLYFPDDGTNTVRHAGDQQFMLRGAEAAAPEIITRALDALVEQFERS
jgi:hypothetical protein